LATRRLGRCWEANAGVGACDQGGTSRSVRRLSGSLTFGEILAMHSHECVSSRAWPEVNSGDRKGLFSRKTGNACVAKSITVRGAKTGARSLPGHQRPVLVAVSPNAAVVTGNDGTRKGSSGEIDRWLLFRCRQQTGCSCAERSAPQCRALKEQGDTRVWDVRF